MNDDIKAGDKVKLVSGSSTMTVELVKDHSISGNQIGKLKEWKFEKKL